MARILLRMRTTGTTTDVEGRTKSERKGRDASRRCVHLFDDDVLRPLHVASRSFPSPWESRCSSLRRPWIYPPPEAGDANYSGSCEQFVEHRRAYVFNSHGALRAPRVFICSEYRGRNTGRRKLSRHYGSSPVCLCFAYDLVDIRIEPPRSR